MAGPKPAALPLGDTPKKLQTTNLIFNCTLVKFQNHFFEQNYSTIDDWAFCVAKLSSFFSLNFSFSFKYSIFTCVNHPNRAFAILNYLLRIFKNVKVFNLPYSLKNSQVKPEFNSIFKKEFKILLVYFFLNNFIKRS